MARIKIVDLPQDATISAEEMKKVLGGVALANTALGSPVVPLNPGGMDNLVMNKRQVLPDLGETAGWFSNCQCDCGCHAVAGVRG